MAGASVGAAYGAAIGATGGTFVVPGVGTLAGAGGGAVAGGLVGGISGTAAGLAEDLKGATVEMGRLSRALGRLILIGLGALNPQGVEQVPLDVRKRDDPETVVDDPPAEKPRGAGEPPKKKPEPER